MRRYQPIDFSRIKTYPLNQRRNKVSLKDFGRPSNPFSSFRELLDSFPKILAGNDFRNVVKSIVNARGKDKPVIFMLGAHVIKCGLSPIIIDLMKRDIVGALALNGAGSIHDFEIALIGETSEDVAYNLRNGSFGLVEETGRLMNEAIIEGVKEGIGIGEALGRKLTTLQAPYRESSLLATGLELDLPVTVHVAIGTDIIHQHPQASGEALGEGSFYDFRLFTSVVSQLGEGGVLVNMGSAVILPEVFLKALTIARNLGYKVRNFTTVNLDMIQHYRPRVNVVERPVLEGGKGYALTGHHEIMIPLLARAILEELKGEPKSGELGK